MLRTLEHPSEEKRLRNLGLCILGKSRLRRDLPNANKYLKGEGQKDGIRLFTSAQ